jgi:hypothetical protein
MYQADLVDELVQATGEVLIVVPAAAIRKVQACGKETRLRLEVSTPHGEAVRYQADATGCFSSPATGHRA